MTQFTELPLHNHAKYRDDNENILEFSIHFTIYSFFLRPADSSQQKQCQIFGVNEIK